MFIKSVTIKNFKSIADEKTFNFNNDIVVVSGRNGIGKSTIADAIFWCLFDKDYSLKSNPPIATMNMEECEPTVSIVMDIDGVEKTLTKIQKRKLGKPDANGVRTVALTNTYEINCVPKREADVKEFINETFKSVDNLLLSMHTDVFTGKKAADMRSALFEMVTSKSDLEIATLINSPLAEKLQGYKLEELVAMNKATIKKVSDRVSSIPEQIVGMENAKVDYDVAELELQKVGCESVIANADNQLEEIGQMKKFVTDRNQKLLDMKFELSSLRDKDGKNRQDELNKAHALFYDLTNKGNSLNNSLSLAERDLSDCDNRIISLKENLESQEQTKKALESREFDESSTICPTCGREYDEDKKSSIKAEFERQKADGLADAERNIDATRNSIKEYETKRVELSGNVDSIRKELELNQNLKDDAKKKCDEIESTDVKPSKETLEQIKAIEDLEKAIEEEKANIPDAEPIKVEKAKAQEELKEVLEKIAVFNRNVEIDEKISVLQSEQIALEQEKANAEQILYFADELSKKKNELLTEEINSHFGIVKWQLFEYLKNGNYKECCKPIVDGKEFGTETNTGLEVLAQIDICDSFQNFYGIKTPIIIDGAERLNKSNYPSVNTQVIYLVVTEEDQLNVK